MHFAPIDFVGYAGMALLVGNLTYVVQLSSLLMRNIAWLRLLAIAAGVIKIIYRLFFVPDPVSVFWESTFLVVNLGQLALIWWENRPPTFTAEEQYFIDVVVPDLAAPDARILLNGGNWVDLPEGAEVTTEGKRLDALIFIAAGEVRIERGGVAIAACGPGDFLGEMTYASGNPATATSIAVGPLRCLRFERAALDKAQARRPVLRMALHASFNRNLIEKLLRSSPPVVAPGPRHERA